MVILSDFISLGFARIFSRTYSTYRLDIPLLHSLNFEIRLNIPSMVRA